MMINKVKKCPQCGKPNAFTLSTCNECKRPLTDVQISFTHNLFTSFIFGIAKGPFPFTISLRYEADDLLVLDDLNAISPCHLSVIPTLHYIPDWRFLLRRPAEGLKIVQRMQSGCMEVFESQFLKNTEWRATYLNDSLSDKEILDSMVAGFNYPPSQYQLHIQFMLPVLTPFQFYQYRSGLYFTPRRYFLYKYVQNVLSALAEGEKALPDQYLKEETKIDDLIAAIKETLGIDYYETHKKFCESFEHIVTKFSNWNPNYFEGVILDNSTYFSWDGKVCYTSPAEIANILKQDKEIIQSYGKPLDEGKKMTGSYYSFAKKPEQLENW